MDRGLIAAIFQPGVLGFFDLKVSAAGGMSVSTYPGWCVVAGTTNINQGSYLDFNDAAVSTTHSAADGTNPRIDQVVLRIYDSTEVGSGSDLGQIEIIAGTPAGGATLDNRTGAASLPVSCLRLADVLIPAGSTSVSGGNIRDRRPYMRGIKAQNTVDGTGATIAGGAWTSIPTLQGRAELSGKPLIMYMNLHGSSAVMDLLQGRILFNSADVSGGRDTKAVYNLNSSTTFVFENVQPTAGSKLFAGDLYFSPVGQNYILDGGAQIRIVELVAEGWQSNW